MQVLAEILTLNGLTNGGSLDISAGAEIKLIGYNSSNSFEAGGSLAGDGSFSLEAGLTVNAAQNVAVQNFNLATGYGLAGTGELTFSKSFNWSNGLVECPVVIAPSGILNLTAAGGSL